MAADFTGHARLQGNKQKWAGNTLCLHTGGEPELHIVCAAVDNKHS